MKQLTSVLFGLVLLTSSLFAADLDPSVQAKVDEQIPAIQAIASDPTIVNAVKAQNASLPADYAAMTQDKWKAANMLDPFVRALAKNGVAEFLRTKKGATISEAFVNDAAGLKVGFINKTTGWSHKGSAKHESPMQGKTWLGSVELDASSGVQQIQVSVPVLDGGKPIGSLVVGLSLSKLK